MLGVPAGMAVSEAFGWRGAFVGLAPPAAIVLARAATLPGCQGSRHPTPVGPLPWPFPKTPSDQRS
ncbi:hypothetical protein AB4144_53015, partial [Rhizobiaceae sp. 2RAB30]